MFTLECPAIGKNGQPHGVVAKGENGAAYHASWCAEYRKVLGIPDDAPGVRQSTAREKAEPTLDGVMAALAARGEPAQAVAAEPVTLADVLAELRKR